MELHIGSIVVVKKKLIANGMDTAGQWLIIAVVVANGRINMFLCGGGSWKNITTYRQEGNLDSISALDMIAVC